jgi:uncharacterized protein YndB with AHSA1/START domain
MPFKPCFSPIDRIRNTCVRLCPITLTRTIDAPVSQVFQAWTDSTLIQRWLAPQPCEVRQASADARPGGRYTIVVVEPNGNVHTTSGEYRAVVPGRRLVKTWSYAGPFGSDKNTVILDR